MTYDNSPQNGVIESVNFWTSFGYLYMGEYGINISFHS